MLIFSGYPKNTVPSNSGYDLVLFGKRFLDLFTTTIDYDNSFIEFIIKDRFKEDVNIKQEAPEESHALFFIAVGIIIFLVILLVGFVLSYCNNKNEDKLIMEEKLSSSRRQSKQNKFKVPDALDLLSVNEAPISETDLIEEDYVQHSEESGSFR